MQRLNSFPLGNWLVMAAALCLVACSGTQALYRSASNVDEYAKAMQEHHNAIGTQIAALVQDPLVSESSKGTLRSTWNKSLPAVEVVSRAGSTYERISTAAAVAGSAVTPAEIQAAEAALQAAVNDLAPLISELIKAIQGAK